MKIEVVLTETEIAQEFADSLEARDLPEKFFYWSPPSVRAWKVLSRESGYFNELNGTWKAVAAKAPELARHFGSSLSLISFGAGEGLKDRLLLHALSDAGFKTGYFPVDASQTLLETACAGAEDDDFDATGIKADISSPVHLVFASDAAESARLFLMAGCTLGGFDPLAEIEYVAQCLRGGDRLLVDAELAVPDTLARRNTPAVRQCAIAPLAAIGFSADDGDLRFEQRRDERHDGLFQVARHFHARRDLRTTCGAADLLIQKGERIAMNFQYVFSPEAFRWLLHEHGGLKIVEEFPSEEGRYVTVLCSK